MKKNSVFVNTIPHSGTHLVTVILDMLGYEHAIFRNRFYSMKPYYRRWQRAGINWRTATEIGNLLRFFDKRNIPVSVASPRMARASVVASLLSKINDGQYIIGHVPYSEEGKEVVEENVSITITVIRDPRDMALSMISHIETRPQHYAYDYLFNELSSKSERLRAVVLGYSNKYGHLAGILKMYESMLSWQKESNNITLKFEDLVGEKGGGDATLQYISIKSLVDRLNLSSSINDDRISEIGKRSFGNSGTFRKGKIGRWRTVFNEQDKEVCKSSISDLLINLGYEANNEW